MFFGPILRPFRHLSDYFLCVGRLCEYMGSNVCGAYRKVKSPNLHNFQRKWNCKEIAPTFFRATRLFWFFLERWIFMYSFDPTWSLFVPFPAISTFGALKLSSPIILMSVLSKFYLKKVLEFWNEPNVKEVSPTFFRATRVFWFFPQRWIFVCSFDPTWSLFVPFPAIAIFGALKLSQCPNLGSLLSNFGDFFYPKFLKNEAKIFRKKHFFFHIFFSQNIYSSPF